MAKSLEKSLKSTSQNPSPNMDSSVGGFTLAALVAVFIFGWFAKRKKTYRSFKRAKPATEKQLRYLEHMVSDQNFFRAKPISLEDWMYTRKVGGFISSRFASQLIQSLKMENEALTENFAIQKKRKGIGRYRGKVYVSDLQQFNFCERSAYFSVLQYPNQNLVELGLGEEVHQAYSDSKRRDSDRISRVANFVREHETSLDRIEWFRNAREADLHHATLPLSGRPDGLLLFRDGTRAVIELKSVSKLPAVPRGSDFVQADAYALLLPTERNTRDESFVLYAERGTRELSLHRRKRVLTEYDLAEVVAKIERAARSNGELNAAKSAAQCATCGFRAICSFKKAS
jgi:CRISPR/Cas system-associated exonuclease Cas4 (RecB family)